VAHPAKVEQEVAVKLEELLVATTSIKVAQVATAVALLAMVGLQTLATTSIKEAQVATLGTSMLPMAVQLVVKLEVVLAVVHLAKVEQEVVVNLEGFLVVDQLMAKALKEDLVTTTLTKVEQVEAVLAVVHLAKVEQGVAVNLEGILVVDQLMAKALKEDLVTTTLTKVEQVEAVLAVVHLAKVEVAVKLEEILVAAVTQGGKEDRITAVALSTGISTIQMSAMDANHTSKIQTLSFLVQLR